MSQKRNYDDFFQKASKYELLANYFKYTDPNKHIAYYQKHLHYMNMATQIMRTQAMTNLTPGGSGKVRFVHAAIDAPKVDIYIDGFRILKDFSYKEVSNYLPVPAGKHQIDIYPSGNMVSTVLSRKVIVENGKLYTFIPNGPVKNLKWLSLEDNPLVPMGETKVRFVHLSQDAPAIDIAVKDRDVIFSNLAYRKFTNYLALTPMTLDLDARITGTSTVALSMPQLQFKQNKAYSVLMIGSTAGEPELEALIIKN